MRSGKYAMFRRGSRRMRYCLYPLDERSREALTGVPEGGVVGVRLSTDRSLPQHNRFWKILDHVAKATHWENAERLLVGLKIRLGRYDVCQLPNGARVPVPQSISFAAMSQAEFQRFFDEAMHIIVTEVSPGFDPDVIAIDVEPRTVVTRMLKASAKELEKGD